MAYRNKDQQRKYSREWTAKRRRDFFTGKTCVSCHSSERLELHHIDRWTKISHCIWSWSKHRRAAEIAKCVVLCATCHQVETNKQRARPIRHGTTRGYRRGCRCRSCNTAVRDYNRTRKCALLDSNQ